jgi:hypothetical protein
MSRTWPDLRRDLLARIWTVPVPATVEDVFLPPTVGHLPLHETMGKVRFHGFRAPRDPSRRAMGGCSSTHEGSDRSRHHEIGMTLGWNPPGVFFCRVPFSLYLNSAMGQRAHGHPRICAVDELSNLSGRRFATSLVLQDGSQSGRREMDVFAWLLRCRNVA